MTRSERDIIEIIRKSIPEKVPDRLVKGIGDDCAVIRCTRGTVDLITMDTLVQGVHFNPSWHGPELLGRKAVSVNISDIAAMGGKPLFAFLAVALPGGTGEQWMDRFMQGLLDVLAENGAALVGGDTVRSDAGITVTVTLTGEAEEGKVLYRHTAEVGDVVWVSGYLGEAGAGLRLCEQGYADSKDEHFRKLINRHLDPAPRVALGRLLAQSGLVNAMMDLSDGLATDLAHICRESGAGAQIHADALPISAELKKGAQFLDTSVQDLALAGGEDFELLFTAAPQNSRELKEMAMARTGIEIYPVGSITAEDRVRLCEGGRETDITYKGFDHFPPE